MSLILIPSAGLEEIPFLSAAERQALSAAGIESVASLLNHFPRRYEDRRRFDRFPTHADTVAVCLRGTVTDASTRFSGPGRKFFGAIITDAAGGAFGSGRVTCRWFNMPFIQKIVATGQDLCVYGKVKEFKGRLFIDHPEFEVLREDDDTSIHLERIVPIYRNLPGIAQRRLREILHQLLPSCSGDGMTNSMSAGLVAPDFRSVHFPDSMEMAHDARRRFAFEEFFHLQLNVLWRRHRHLRQNGRMLGRDTRYLKRFHASLPFELTGAQKRSIKEILADMRDPRPMNRLLQGDVGAGKTFVAMAAMLLAVGSGCQAALMAPTQILAEQHYLTFRRWLDPVGIRIGLRTGNRNESNRLELEGEPQIIIGTHALLFDPAIFTDLGLVVIDEQHKFGVSQRAALVRQGIMPDVLVITATPIPRTLTMTVYGDLDVSIVDEKPPGRGRIVTAVRKNPKQPAITAFLREQLAQGRQIYLVYPLVEESGTLKAESAIEAFPKWRKRLAGHAVGLIHGRLAAEEKEVVMEDFRAGRLQALVATSVIEVGVDVPNATVMMIHHAERFGLAQLHQLRGRVGRGGNKSWCILLTDAKNPEAEEKLKVLESTADGFEIAEADLRLRGPGDVLGTAQSGLSEIRFTDFLADTTLLREARDLAESVLTEDPELTGSHAGLRSVIHQEPADGLAGGG